MSSLPPLKHDIQSTRCHAMSTFANKYPSNGTWTAAKLFSFHRHVKQMPRIWYHAKACCVAARLTVSRGIHLWACRGWSRITSVNSLTNENKLAGRRTVPVFDAACEFQVVPGPAQELQDCCTRRSNNVTEAQVHRDVPPPCAPVISGRRAAIDVPLLLCFMHHSGRDR